MTRVACLVALGIAVSLQSGCEANADASGSSIAEQLKGGLRKPSVPTVIDAGIIFADEASYLCVPLRRLGIADSDEVLSVITSCECTDPSIVRFNESRNKVSRALYVKFAPESAIPTVEPTPLNLGVVITLEMSSGQITSATIQFLHTTQASQR